MKKVFDIALKDMTQFFRSMIALVMMFAVPILLTGMFYIMFGGGGADDAFEIPITAVIVVNLDEGGMAFDPGYAGDVETSDEQGIAPSEANSMGDILTEMLEMDAFAELMDVNVMESVDDAKAAVDNQEAGVAIIIPENFSEAYMSQNPGEQAVIGYYYDPGLTLGPNIVRGVVQQFMDGFSSSRITLLVTFAELSASGTQINAAVSQAVVSSFMTQMQDQSGGVDAAGFLRVRNPAGESVEGMSADGMAMISMMMAGMTVFYVFFTGASVAQSLITEDEKGTLPRLFTTPTAYSTILGGKFAAGVLMILVQITVLMVFGNLVFQIAWGKITTLLPVIVAMTLAASTFGIFLMSWAKTERQAGLMIGSVVTIMGMLGMLPIFVLSMPNPPQIVSTLTHLVPHGWAVEGLRIAMMGGASQDVLINALVLLAWAVLFFVIGVVRFRKRFA